MGRRRTGSVAIRATSIRIVFSWNGVQRHETLYLDAGRPLPPTPPNIKHAERVAADVGRAIASGAFKIGDYFPFSKHADAVQAGSVGDFLDTWFAQAELKRSTLKTYKRMKDNFWKPHIGHILLPALRHSDITTALKKGGWPSGKTRNNYLSMLSTALDLAVNDEKLARNPCARIESATWQKKGVDPFSADEAEAIIAHLHAKYPEQVGNMVEFWFFTGLRTSEIIALDWEHVDLRRRQAVIDQGFVIDALEDTTKTGMARTVLLNSRAMAAILRQKAHTFLAGKTVFHDPGTGTPWAYEQNFRKRYWTPTLKALGIRYRRAYYCRSTYATICLMAGANPAFVAQQLGHGLDVFFRDYAKWINADQDRSELVKIERQIVATMPELCPGQK